MHITLSFLVLLEACAPQRTIFADTFPDGLRVEGPSDPEVLMRISRSRLDAHWLARHVLTPRAFEHFDSIDNLSYVAYQEAIRVASEEYWSVRRVGKEVERAWARENEAARVAWEARQMTVLVALWDLLANPENHTSIVRAYFASGVPPVTEGAPS